MTMSSAVSKVTLNGDGVQTSWPFAFKVWKAADLEVSITNPEGATTVVSNWTVVLAGQGGTVTYPTTGDPLPSGHKITIRRSMDFLQDVDLVSGTRWDPEVVETALDQATAERQQLKEEMDRALKLDVSDTTSPAALLDSIFEARDTAVDNAASALDSAERAEIAASTVAYYNHEGTLLTGESVITLPWAYDTQVGVEVYLSGVKQTESTLVFTNAYTVTLTEAVTADTPFEVVASAGASSDLQNILSSSTGSATVGHIAAGAGAVARTVQAKLRDVVSVKDFGAIMDGVADDADAIDAALAASDYVFIPPGNIAVSRTISIPQRKVLVGSGYKTTMVAVAVTGAVISITSGNGPTAVKDLRISGTADAGVLVNGAQLLDVSNISLDGLTATNGFIFKSTWGSSFKDLFTNGAVISNACFICGGAFNANRCENWYSSNRCNYGLFIDATYDGGSGSSHGSTWSQMTMQSGLYGIYVRAYQAGTFSGVYTEDVVYALRIGDKANGRLARGMCFAGGDFAGPTAGHPDYASRDAVLWFDYALGCRLSGIELSGCFNCGAAAPVTITGNGTGATALARVTAAGVVHSVEVICPGSGYTSATATIGGAGSGATLSVTVSGGLVESVAVVDGGAGYAPGKCPVAIIYDTAFKCVIDGVFLNTGQGDNSQIYPWIVRKASANSGAGISLNGDTSRRNSSNGNTCDLRKTQGFAYKHAVVEWTSAGALATYVYTPPQFP